MEVGSFEEHPSESSGGPSQMVSAHAPSADRMVFTVGGNTDAWIASDTVMEIER